MLSHSVGVTARELAAPCEKQWCAMQGYELTCIIGKQAVAYNRQVFKASWTFAFLQRADSSFVGLKLASPKFTYLLAYCIPSDLTSNFSHAAHLRRQ